MLLKLLVVVAGACFVVEHLLLLLFAKNKTWNGGEQYMLYFKYSNSFENNVWLILSDEVVDVAQKVTEEL